ncbi:MAG: malectin domain-containing carbohydrate-binding protein, partial [Pseudomonadota bacterium]
GEETILYRVNVGGEALAAVDDGPDWEESSKDDISVYSVGESIRGGDLALAIDLSNVDAGVAPSEMFNSHYWDNRTTPEAMHWAFAVETGKEYRINLYFAETQSKFNETKIREFDFTVDGVSVAEFQDVNPYLDGGGQTGGASMRSAVVTAADGLLDIVSAVDQQNPLLSGIEIIEIGD